MTPSAILHALAGSSRMDGVEDVPARCAICAEEAPRTAPFDAWQGANFTDQNKVRAWGTGRICEPCAWAHSWAPPPGYPPQEEGKKGVNLRLFSHFWDERDGYSYANKADKPRIRAWLRERSTMRDRAWFAAIADSGQKHVLPWTRINPAGATRALVRFDEREVRIGDWRLVDALTDLLTDGVTKDEIEPGDYRLLTWQQSGEAVERFEQTFGSLRGSGWWSLALWLSQRDEDEWKRRDDGRREARALARHDREARAGRPSGVPRRGRKPAEALGPDQGPDEGRGLDERVRVGVDDVAPARPRARRPRQPSLFGD